MNVLAIIGTKRKKGLTTKICEEIIKGAKKNNNNTWNTMLLGKCYRNNERFF